MLHAIVIKFPKPGPDEHSLEIFDRLVFYLANNNDNKVWSMTGAAIKLLIGHVSPHSLHSVIEYSFSWYVVGNQDLWSAAAQHSLGMGDILLNLGGGHNYDRLLTSDWMCALPYAGNKGELMEASKHPTRVLVLFSCV
ncbi:hypothetical protein RHGRI_026228 [Rhododendron griersonianum]|uniref:Uncharacterized protein n=1 Tax=Rhododendron griersonianum TaxID=479676 RepID=A0AAV6IUC0_9ERIC|nr:hypothetical protein RHGRI_026228 [Rhododendron griersonianum]